jgi:hypothetical protein
MYFLHQLEHLYANLCDNFEVNMMLMMRINGVCKYTEIYEYEANKIDFFLDSLRSKNNSCEYGAPYLQTGGGWGGTHLHKTQKFPQEGKYE